MRTGAAVRVGSALVLLLSLSASAAADGFYCGTHLVSSGNSASDVTYKCGKPDSVTPLVEYICQPDFGPCHRTVIGERWEYDLGPARFVRVLIFRGGCLTDVLTGAYGHKQSRAPTADGASR